MDSDDMRRKSSRNQRTSSKRSENRRNTLYPVDERGVIDIRGRAKRVARKSGNKNMNRIRAIKQIVFSLLPFVLIAVVLFGLLAYLTRKNALEVMVADSTVGHIAKDKDITEEYLTGLIVAQLENEQGTKVQLLDEVTIKEVHVDSKKMIKQDFVLAEARKIIGYQIQAGVIHVEGKDTLILQNEQEAKSVLEQMTAVYTARSENLHNSGFVESVVIRPEFVDQDKIITSQKALQILQTSTDELINYTIGSGDVLSKIATRAGVTVTAILDANPGMTRETVLRIGDSINLPTKVPFVSVYTEERIVTEQSIPMPVETIEDDTKPFGYSGVSQQGENGTKEIVTIVKKINGLETERGEPTEVITKQPIKQVIIKGIKQ